MEDVYKEVYFNKYCETCEHKDLDEKFDPCNDCLAEPMNAESKTGLLEGEEKRLIVF